MTLALLQAVLTNSLAYVFHLNSNSFSSAVCLKTSKNGYSTKQTTTFLHKEH